MISLFIIFVAVAVIGFDYALAADEDSAGLGTCFTMRGIFQLLVLCSGIQVLGFNEK
jgi:hypothetical protein